MLAVWPALTLTSAVSSCLYTLEPIRPATTRIIPKCTTYAAVRVRLPVKARPRPDQRLLPGPAARRAERSTNWITAPTAKPQTRRPMKPHTLDWNCLLYTSDAADDLLCV